MSGGGQFALHVIDREIALAHGYRQIPNAVARGRRLRTALRPAEEGSALLGIMAELMAKDAEGAGGVAEAAGHVGRGLLIDEVSAEGFVLALHRELRGQEEVSAVRRCYPIRSAGLHILDSATQTLLRQYV